LLKPTIPEAGAKRKLGLLMGEAQSKCPQVQIMVFKIISGAFPLRPV
jgi:hypothetical protein